MLGLNENYYTPGSYKTVSGINWSMDLPSTYHEYSPRLGSGRLWRKGGVTDQVEELAVRAPETSREAHTWKIFNPLDRWVLRWIQAKGGGRQTTSRNLRSEPHMMPRTTIRSAIGCIRFPKFIVDYSVFLIRYIIWIYIYVWYMIYDIWYMIYDIWYMIYVCMYIYVYAHAYIYIYIYVHTQIYIHILL